jgi:hypothetical protein
LFVNYQAKIVLSIKHVTIYNLVFAKKYTYLKNYAQQLRMRIQLARLIVTTDNVISQLIPHNGIMVNGIICLMGQKWPRLNRFTNFYKWHTLNGKYVSLGVSTVKTNPDWDWDFSICRDQLLKLVKIILTVKTRLFFVFVNIFKIETFESRLCCVEVFIKIVLSRLRYDRDKLRA